MKRNLSQSRRKFFKTSSLLTGFLLLNRSYSSPNSSRLFNTVLNQTGTNAFFLACAQGDLKIVKKLVEENIELMQLTNEKWQSGFTIALLNQHKNVGDYLIEKGYQPDLHESALHLDWDRFNEMIGEDEEKMEAIVNKNHPIGGTAMFAASAGGAGTNIWRIYGANGDPNKTYAKNGNVSPLQIALLYPDLNVAELTAASLLANHANPNPVDYDSQPSEVLPPLHLAAQRGSLELVEMLIRLGAKINQLDYKGRSAKEVAAYFGQTEARSLLDSADNIVRTSRTSRYSLNAYGKSYNRPVMQAYSANQQGALVGNAHRNLEAVKNAVEKDPNLAHSIATTSEGAVEAGAHMGNKEIVKTLLDQGAPCSMCTAVMINNKQIIQQHLNEDKNRIHDRGAHDFPLLWYPIIGSNKVELLEYLLEQGAKVEEQHYLGTTALHWASLMGDIECAEFLLENGANINRVGRKFSSQGDTPLQLCRDEKMIKFLKEKGAK